MGCAPSDYGHIFQSCCNVFGDDVAESTSPMENYVWIKMVIMFSELEIIINLELEEMQEIILEMLKMIWMLI